MSGAYSAATGTGTKTLRMGRQDYRSEADAKTAFNATLYTKNVKITKQYVYGGKLSVPTATRRGYTLNGWYTETSGGTKVTNDTAVPAANTTYYAQWTGVQFTMVFNKNATDAAGTMANQKIPFGTETALTANAFTRTGYTFMGWNTNAAGTGTVYTDKQKVSTLNEDGGTINLYAIWRKNSYTVQFNGNGSTSGSTANQNINYSTAKALTANGFVKAGYTFTKWNDGINNYNDKANVNINMNLLNNTSSSDVYKVLFSPTVILSKLLQ